MNPFVESLENRTLLSATASLDQTGVLRVRGYEQAANTIVVGNSEDGLDVVVTVTSVTRRGTKTFTGSFHKSEGITRLHIWGGHKADAITIDQTHGAFDVVTRIDGRDGNDTITAGDETDRISGGRGDDTIVAGGGGDLIYGFKGNDDLSGGDGNDTLWGGLGNDTLSGEGGNDKLGGALGANVMTGGEGEDTFVVRSLAANPTNDYDAATDVLKDKASTRSDEAAPPPFV